MKDSANYAKIVEWSEEDQCYVGSCPYQKLVTLEIIEVGRGRIHHKDRWTTTPGGIFDLPQRA